MAQVDKIYKQKKALNTKFIKWNVTLEKETTVMPDNIKT